jgi:hypothetical protein
LAATGTLRSTPANPASTRSSPPGSSASSATPRTFVDAKARNSYPGTTPITRASGTKKIALARHARNRRLGDALQQWALCSMRGSPAAKANYQQLRDRHIGHQAALRQLANRLVGILHGCLKTATTHNEHTTWDHHTKATA